MDDGHRAIKENRYSHAGGMRIPQAWDNLSLHPRAPDVVSFL